MRRLSNVRKTTTASAVLVLAAATLGPAASATALASTSTVTIKVIGISRTGAQVAVNSVVTPLHGSPDQGNGPTFDLKPGRYFIFADVPTAASGSNAASQAMVVRQVNVRTSETVKLDSRGAKLVSVWLNGKNLGSPPSAAACFTNNRGGLYSDPEGGPIYLKAGRAPGLNFIWAINSGVQFGTGYDLTGKTTAGFPANPTFRLRTAQLSKTVIQTRSGTVPLSTAIVSTTSTLNPSCPLPGISEPIGPPYSFTVLRSPALWTTRLDTFHDQRQCDTGMLATKEVRGHRYTVTLGGAVRGPSEAVPVVETNSFSYDPQLQFLEPVTQAYDYCFGVTVTLSNAGHVVASKHYVQPVNVFSATVHTGRRYVLNVDARQATPGAKLTGLLSPRTTLTWRFKLAKPGNGALPLAVTSLRPAGLDLRNRAAPGSMTPVRAFFTQGSYDFPQRSASPVRSFTVQASFNDGKTWHRVAVVKHRGFFTFVVHNPRSGFVTLRTTTVNKLGFSSEETIYRAYAIR